MARFAQGSYAKSAKRIFRDLWTGYKIDCFNVVVFIAERVVCNRKQEEDYKIKVSVLFSPFFQIVEQFGWSRKK